MRTPRCLATSIVAPSLLLLLLAAPPAAAFSCASAGRNAAACASLGDLYAATSGAQWRNNTGWALAAVSPSASSPADYCAFFGVTCDAAGNVTALCVPVRDIAAPARAGVRADIASQRNRSLSLNLLHGTLPASLSALSALTSLSAAHNYLSGPLPAWSLPALRELDLADNVLRRGGVPDALLALPSLSLGSNLLDAGDVSPALCGALCGAGAVASPPFARAFQCNASASPARTCALLAPAADLSCADALCEPTCPAALSVSDWAAQASAGAACADSGLRRCSVCASPVFAPLSDEVANSSDVLFACVQAHQDTMLAAGLNTLTVESGVLCAALLPVVALGDSVAAATAACARADHDMLRAFGPSLADARATQAACAPFSTPTFDAAVCGRCAAAATAPFARAGVADATTMRSCVYDFAIDLFATQAYMALFTLFACPDEALLTHTTAAAPASLPASVLGGAVGGAVGGAAALAAALACLLRARRAAALRSASTELLSVTTARKDGTWLGSGFDEGSTMPALRGSLDGLATLRVLTVDAREIRLGPRLGEGGFGAVHRATWRGSEVAVKVFFPVPVAAAALQEGSRRSATGAGTSMGAFMSWPSSWGRLARAGGAGGRGGRVDALQRGSTFVQECALLSRLRHPNILSVYAIVTTPQRMIVMELGLGGSLKALLERSDATTLPWARRVALAHGVACGVAFLHAQQPPIAHGDLKPANVVLDATHMPKLCDFGLGTTERGSGRVPGASFRGVAGFTPRYCAPEVALYTPLLNRLAADCYGLGMVMLDIAHVNSAPTGTQQQQQAQAQPPDEETVVGLGALAPPLPAAPFVERMLQGFAVEVAPHVPPPFGALILECLAVEPAARLHTSAVRERLANIMIDAGWTSLPAVAADVGAADSRAVDVAALAHANDGTCAT
jgi:serine/threonine protein kinase